MKRSLMLLAAIALMVGFSGKVMGQSTTTNVDVAARLLSQIAVSKSGNLNFGTLLLGTSFTSDASVVLDPSNTYGTATNVTKVTNSITAVPRITVTGYRTCGYSITITGGTLKYNSSDNLWEQMTLSDYTGTIVGGTNSGSPITFDSGVASRTFATDQDNEVFDLGAKLNIPYVALQTRPNGLYEGTITVTVAYQ